MLKRTMGRFLLTVLVITGLAGTINNTSISKQERKSSMVIMKDTRAEVLKSVKDLSDRQLNFKSAPDHWSIKECMYHIAISEKNLWELLQNTMKLPPNPEQRKDIKVNDQELIAMIESRTVKVKTTESLEPKNTPFKSLDDAVTSFKQMRGEHIKYLKSTTEDLRNHVVKMPFGSIDCYQLCLMIAAHSNRHRQQIDEVKADPGYPK